MSDATAASVHQLIPGTSAFTLYRVASRVSVALSIVFALCLGLARTEFGDDKNIPPAFWLLVGIPLLVGIVVSVILFRIAFARTNLELASGYTTRSSGFTNYDQVDPKTGTVIRRSGSAVFSDPSTVTAAPSTAAAFDAPRFMPDPRMARRKVIAAIVLPIVIVIALTGAFSSAGGGSGGAIALGIMAALIVLIFGGVFLGVGIYMQRFLSTARNGDPSTFAFASRSTPELVGAAATLGLSLPGSTTFGVAVARDGIQLWKRRANGSPSTLIPWNQIDHIQPARLMVASGNASVAAATLHVFVKHEPELIDIPIPVYGRRAMGFANVTDANAALDVVSQYARIA